MPTEFTGKLPLGVSLHLPLGSFLSGATETVGGAIETHQVFEPHRRKGKAHWNPDEKPLDLWCISSALYWQNFIMMLGDKGEMFQYQKAMEGGLETRDDELISGTFTYLHKYIYTHNYTYLFFCIFIVVLFVNF